MPSQTQDGFERSARGLRMRGQLGLSGGHLQGLLGAALIPLWVSGGTGWKGWFASVGAALRFGLPLVDWLEATLGAGADLWLRRLELQAHGRSVIATPRFELWLDAGLRARLVP